MRVLKYVCKKLSSSTLKEICSSENFEKWEQEIILELYGKDRSKTIETLEYTSRASFYKKIDDLETKFISILFEKQIINYNVLLMCFLKNKDKDVLKTF